MSPEYKSADFKMKKFVAMKIKLRWSGTVVCEKRNVAVAEFSVNYLQVFYWAEGNANGMKTSRKIGPLLRDAFKKCDI